MIAPGLRRVELEDIAAWEEGPKALQKHAVRPCRRSGTEA